MIITIYQILHVFGIFVFLHFLFSFLYFCTFVLELNPCLEPGGRPPGDNYNHLSVPDPATACGNLLYKAGGGRKTGASDGSSFWFLFFVHLLLGCCVVFYGEVYQVFTSRTF